MNVSAGSGPFPMGGAPVTGNQNSPLPDSNANVPAAGTISDTFLNVLEQTVKAGQTSASNSNLTTAALTQSLAMALATETLSQLALPGADGNSTTNPSTGTSLAASSNPLASLWPLLNMTTSPSTAAESAPAMDTFATPASVDDAIQSASSRYGVPIALIRSVMEQESGMNPTAVSSAGAIGLMQLMPGTAAGLGVNPWNPTENIDGGTRYLSQLLSRFQGNVQLALAAYNAGPSAVASHGGIPPYPETRTYVHQVLDRARAMGFSG